MKSIKKLFKIILRIFVIVLIGGVVASNFMDYTFSAINEKNPNVLITISKDGSISQVGNLFDGELYPATALDAEKGIGGINGVVRIQNQFKKIDVNNLAIGIKDMEIRNNNPRDIVFNSFLKNIKLKIEKGLLFSFNKTLVDYTSLENVLYESGNDEYSGYILDSNDKFSLNKGDAIDLKYSLLMDVKAGNELQSVTAYMPIYINLGESKVIDDKENNDNDDKIVTIKNLEVPTAQLNKEDHLKYIQGYPDNTVRPEALITREEIAAVFYRLLDSNYRTSIFTEKENFNDVNSDRWSLKYISTLSNGNIVEGYPDGSFKPKKSITRAELATIASKFDKLDNSETKSFHDIEGHWAAKYINSAAEKGWIKGYADGTFRPDQYITRAEFVTMVNNVLGRGIHKDDILKEAKIFPDLKESMWYYEAMVEATNSHLYMRLEDSSELWTEIIDKDRPVE